MWNPISLNELSEIISFTESDIEDHLKTFWELIRIEPEKWKEKDYGEEGGGFWVVAICGKKVVWYNDIEEGFNISIYHTYGEIQDYFCYQYELNHVVWQLYNIDANFRSSGPPDQ